MEPDARLLGKVEFELSNHDEEVQTAWFGSEWQRKYSGVCAIVAFCAEYGRLLPPLKVGIEKYLIPVFPSSRILIEWVGFGHAAEAQGSLLCRAAICQWCGQHLRLTTSVEPLRIHRKRCRRKRCRTIPEV